MKWILKAAVQKGLSALPNDEAANYWFQRHVTRSWPCGDSVLALHIKEAVRHMQAFRRHGSRDLGKATFYEFGAGWNLIVPLVYYALGIEKQILVDIRPHLRFELVEHGWTQLNRRREEIEHMSGIAIRGFSSRPPKSLEELDGEFGISYLAPRDARDTELPAGSIDFISSTFTLEHISGPDIKRILAECARLLRIGGVISSSVDMEDHYSFFDSSLSPYNFLKFSDPVWRLVNSSLHYQSRLRYPDYLKVFDETGFEVLETELMEPTAQEIDQLRTIRLAARFRDGYSLRDLSIKAAHLVVRPLESCATSPGRSDSKDSA